MIRLMLTYATAGVAALLADDMLSRVRLARLRY